MSQPISSYILTRLQQRRNENNFRTIKNLEGLVDFTSNDYLGFARDLNLRKKIEAEVFKIPTQWNGSTGSRLLSGNSLYAESLEEQLAVFHQAESALLFNSGFDANYGLLSSLPYRNDTIIYDELVHASMHDGIRQSKANAVSFAHNDLSDLESKLSRTTGLKYVVIESIYSMDGDFAPLIAMTNLCEVHDAGLIVDEAHATGLYGSKGEGLVVQNGLQQKVLARVHTFGKALGANGAVVLGSSDLKNFLINYCRPFIFSTALPIHSLAAVKCAYETLPQCNERRDTLFKRIKMFKLRMSTSKYQLLPSDSPIQSVCIEGNQSVKNMATSLQHKGFDVRPILSPTVPKGKERIRICMHSFNSEEEVNNLAEAINTT